MRAEAIWVLPACFALIDWYAVARGDRRTETWAKPLVLSSLIVAAVVLGATETVAGLWLLVALVFGLLGDVALLSNSLHRFRAGVFAFLVGHLAYLVCFASLGLTMPAWSWTGLAVLAVALFATRGVV
ncbi:MAG: lysoplasmalogenase family protein, partial [Nocardioides sp.]